MKEQAARKIADGLSWARLFSIVPIGVLAVMQLKWWVLGLHIPAALTDLADGWVARKAPDCEHGARLDGTADLVFAIATLWWIALLVPGFYGKYWFPFLPSFVALEMVLLVVCLKNKDIVLPHLWSGKLAVTVFSFLLPVLLVFGDVTWFVLIALYVPIAAKVHLVAVVLRSESRQHARSVV
jgi:phosphatidylglycerophosphate synthase